jgi:hypothetical protein
MSEVKVASRAGEEERDLTCIEYLEWWRMEIEDLLYLQSWPFLYTFLLSSHHHQWLS